MKRTASKLLALLLCLAMCLSLLPAGVVSAADEPIKIACIGDSITYGHNPADWGRTQIQNNWPTVLGQQLGDGYDVRNFGQNGITLSKSGGTPVWSIQKFTDSKNFQPDIVIIMLGTNDSPGSDSADKQASLKSDLRELITVYRELDSHPTVYIATCATGFGNGGFGLPPANIHDYIVPLQKEVAAEMGCEIIDVHDFTSDMGADFPDNIHPNEAGHAAIGQFVAEFILAHAGGDPDPGEEPEPISNVPIYEDTSYSFAERAADLIARMSLQQKASQLVERAAAIPASQLGGGALNVPATKDLSHYSWWAEALHGLLRDNENPQSEGTKDNVSYAQSLTMGSTWNPDLYYEGATLIADEIRERSRKNDLGNCINLNFYSPTVNMQRDPRWGRNEESYSEDPYLTGVMGSQFVLGMEGKDQDGNLLDPNGYKKTLTTIKHYTANNTEAIRTSGGADNVDLRALREYYVAPYRDVIRNADNASVMTAYSYLNKEPCSYSSYLMDTLLRQTFGFSGHITSDCDSAKTISNLNYTNPRTGAKLTAVEQMAGALAHGEDLECNSGISANVSDYNQLATQMVSAGVQTDKGTFTENTIDVSVHRLMTARISTGEFDEDNGWTAAANERMADQQARGINNYTPERIAVVDKEVDEGVVMLKNNGVLPLQIPASGDYKVVIIGEHQTSSYLGLYSSEQRHAVDDKWRIWIGPGIEQAIKAKNPNATVTRINSNTISNEDAIRAADAVIVVAGTGSGYSAEGRDRSNTDLPNNLATLISNVGKMNPNTVAVMETCGPMTVTAFENDVAAILWSSFGGIRKGVGFGHVITGVVNPSGHLTATWYRSMNDIPGIRDYNLYATNGSHGRTYMYYDGTNPVSYPFGYGLSYTTFEYSNLKIDKAAYNANDTVKVTFNVKNTGSVAGKDVAQLYIAQPDAPAELNRPIRRLKGFDKFELQPGETKTVSLEVKIPDLAYYNEAKDQFEVDTGRYQVQVGEDSAHANLTADFTVSGTMDEYPVVLTAKPNQTGDDALGIEQRIIFDKGVTVNPQLTVAMNNEKLYGYIIKEQTSIIKSLSSTPLPEGMTFTYESNRPKVAKVEGDKITTVGAGVATITVTGELNGHTVSTDFVVYVMSNVKLDGITVDGEPIAKFSPDKYKYSITLPNKAHKPVVAGSALNPDLKIKVDQVKSLPGVATITTTDPSSGVSATYEINFKVKPSSGGGTTAIDFTTEADAGKYEIAGQSQSAVEEGVGLALTATQGGIEPAKQSIAEADKDVVKVPVSGDWTATLEVEFDTNGARNGYYQFFGFVASEGEDNQNLVGIRGGDGAMQDFIRKDGAITEETKSSSPGFANAGQTYYLRIEKAGTTYICYRSDDGEDWTEMFSYEDCEIEADQILIDAYTGMTEGYKFTLKSLVIEGVGGGEAGLPNIDFTTAADADKYEIAGQTSSEVAEGVGLALVTTTSGVEPAKQSITEEPVDVVEVPVAGDWTATLEVEFDTNGARNGYYQFFGFYASMGDDYQNMVGIRGGDGAMQDFIRLDGAITEETKSSSPGFANAGQTYYLRIEKADTSYICYRSDDGEEFTEMFSYEDTGIDAEKIVIDAYTGMTTGYKFTLKSLEFEGGQGGTEPVDPEVASITVDGVDIGFNPAVTVYNIEVAKDSTKAPVVAAKAGNSGTKVTVEQLSGPFGTAVVTAKAGSKTLTYTVSFNFAPADDYFADGDIDASMWTVENKAGSSVEKGKGIVLPAQNGQGGFKDLYLTPAQGNWAVVAKVFCPTAPAQGQMPMMIVGGSSDDKIVLNAEGLTAAADGSVTVYYKLERKDDLYTASWSQNGMDYTAAGSYEDMSFADPKIGLLSTANAYYEYICATSVGGVEQYNMVEMLRWAAQNVADYVAADLPDEASGDLAFSAIPHGYRMTVASSDPSVIAADGKVTPADSAKDVTVTVTVTEGNISASASKTVKVAGGATSSGFYDAVFLSDLHNGVGGYPGFKQMMAELKNEGLDPRVLSHGGDYVEDSMGGQVNWQTQVYDVISGTEKETFPNATQVYTLGNHDFESGTFGGRRDKEAAFEEIFGFPRCGLAYSDSEMEIYMIGAQGETGSGGGGEAFYEADITAFDQYLATKAGTSKVIFLQTHWPAHSSYNFKQRVVTNADKLIDTINKYGDDIDIVWIWGHNHYEDEMRYVILQPGDQIMYAADTSGSSWGNPRNPQYKTIKFTYANAGCMNDMWWHHDGHNDTNASGNYRGPSACLSVAVENDKITFTYNRIKQDDAGNWVYSHDANLQIYNHNVIKEHPATVVVNRSGSAGPELFKSALREAILAAEAIDRSKYTDASLAALDAALAAGKKAYDEATTQDEITNAALALNAAIAALEPKPVEPPAGDYVKATSIEVGKTYVIVADGKYAMTNRQEGPSLRTYAGGATTTLASAPVTVSNGAITSAVTDDMLWTVEESTAAAAYDGQAQYFLKDASGNYLRRGSGSSGQGAQLLSEALYSTIRYNAWSFYPYEGEDAFAMYANSERAYGTDYPFYVYGNETSFDSPGRAQRDEADPFAFTRNDDCSHITLYVKSEAGPTPIDLAVLEAAIAAAEAIDLSKYTDASADTLRTALAAAKAARTSDSQATVDSAAAALNRAVQGLQLKPELDKTALEAAIAAAEAVDTSKYTDASVAALTSALNAAKAARNATTQSAIDSAANALNNAVKALVLKPTPVEGSYVKANVIEPGMTYVIVADGAYAMTNEEVAGKETYAGFSTTRGAKAVTIEDGVITSEVTDDMLWTFTEADAAAAYDGLDQYFITDANGKYLRRGSMSQSNGALVLENDTTAGNIRYYTWSFKPYDGEEATYAMYANSERAYGTDYPGRVGGNASGFDIPGGLSHRSDGDPFAFMNDSGCSKITLYVLLGVEPCDHDYVPVVTAPTCTEKGYTTYTCSKCGKSYKGDETAALGHAFGEWVTTTAATCTAAGVQTRSCSRCDAKETKAIAATGHTFGEWTVTKAATCTEAGVETRTCANCDAKETRAIAATGHTFGEWAVTKAATCTAEGEETRTCSKCDAKETRKLDKIAHNFKDGKCTVCGADDPDYKPPVDKSELGRVIEPAERLHEADYTPETFAAMKTALDAANAVYAKEDATQAEVDAAVEALKKAVEALKIPDNKADKRALAQALADAAVHQNSALDYTPESIHALDAACAAAAPAMNNENATQEQVDAAVKAIYDAIHALVPAGQFRFDDVKDSKQYYYEPVYWAYEHEPQITNGTSKNLFSPEKGCTRAQVVTFLWRYAGMPEPNATTCSFKDVDKEQYYYKAVLWAVEKKITNGTSETTFDPEKTCTRAQIVTFLWRYAGEPKPATTKNDFKDVKDSAYYYNAVLWAAENDITNGTSATTFDPEKTCTRAQIVTFLYRYDEKKGK